MTLDNGAVCRLNAQWVSKCFIKCLRKPFFKESNVVKITLKKPIHLKYRLGRVHHNQKIRDNYKRN